MIGKNTIPALLGCLIVISLAACSPDEPAQPGVVVDGAVMSQLAPGQSVGAVYLRITNNMAQGVVLNYVHSPVATDIEVHRTFHEDGMMQMRPVNHVRVEAGQSLRFEPGGYHLMLFGVANLPEVGQAFDLTMEFEGGLSVTVPVRVKTPG